MSHKVVGIIGGMGPDATVDLMQKVINSTPAEDDSDHVHMVVDNNPKIPSRIKSLIEKDGASPLTTIVNMAQKLERYGSDFLVMPCNTAHYFYDDIQNSINIPLLSMVGEAIHKTLSYSNIKNVAILASNAVHDLNIYENSFSSYNINVVVPELSHQDNLMQTIKTIKMGIKDFSTLKSIQDCVNSVESQSDAILVACTEISLFTSSLKCSVPLIDVAQVLADTIIARVQHN